MRLPIQTNRHKCLSISNYKMSPKDPTKDDKPTICGVFTDVNETLSGEVIQTLAQTNMVNEKKKTTTESKSTKCQELANDANTY